MISMPRSIYGTMIRGDDRTIVGHCGARKHRKALIAGQVVHSIQNHHTMCASRMMGSKVHVRKRHGPNMVTFGSKRGGFMGSRLGILADPYGPLKINTLQCCANKCKQQHTCCSNIILQQDRLEYTSFVAMIDIHTMTISLGPDHGTPTTMVVDDQSYILIVHAIPIHCGGQACHSAHIFRYV